MTILWIVLGVAFGVIVLALAIFVVRQQTFAILERWGKFIRVVGPGIHVKVPIMDRVAGRVSIRVQELNVSIK
ncbi:MAG TPA: SPFH domain-containing protein, partial [Dehalococcoidia bacterium]|nr:SPFH domain-containing protein [Dehalococcoidia bacterium]